MSSLDCLDMRIQEPTFDKDILEISVRIEKNSAAAPLEGLLAGQSDPSQPDEEMPCGGRG